MKSLLSLISTFIVIRVLLLAIFSTCSSITLSLRDPQTFFDGFRVATIYYFSCGSLSIDYFFVHFNQSKRILPKHMDSLEPRIRRSQSSKTKFAFSCRAVRCPIHRDIQKSS
jgi:hypothetical protein